MLTSIGDVMREAYKRGWITTRDGNISLRKGNKFYITPSGWRKTIIHPEHIIRGEFPTPPTVLVGPKGSVTDSGSKASVRVFRHLWNGMIRGSERDAQRVHPTQNPVALMKWCIDKAGFPGVICDPFMGSGTTGVAASELCLDFIGIEKEQRYFDISCKRIEEAQKQWSLFDMAISSSNSQTTGEK